MKEYKIVCEICGKVFYISYPPNDIVPLICSECTAREANRGNIEYREFIHG